MPYTINRDLGFSFIIHSSFIKLLFNTQTRHIIYTVCLQTFLRNIIIINLPFVMHELTLSLTFSILLSSTLNWIRTSSIALFTKNWPFLSCKKHHTKKIWAAIVVIANFYVLSYTNKAIKYITLYESHESYNVLTAEFTKYTTKHYQTLIVSNKQYFFNHTLHSEVEICNHKIKIAVVTIIYWF